MMIFRLLLFVLLVSPIFSCAHKKDEANKYSADYPEKRLLKIVSVEKIDVKKKSKYNMWGEIPLFLITIKNVGSYDLNIHYERRYPYLKSSDLCKVVFIPNTAQSLYYDDYFFEIDTSLIFKKNEDLTFLLPLSYNYESDFINCEVISVEFRILITTPHDLSYYFDPNPPVLYYRSRKWSNEIIAYDYPLEFTYWMPNNIFWERPLLER